MANSDAMLYDTDGSGSLDEQEFVSVLMLCGFEEAESHRIFHEVDVDGGGGLDLEEFETWWLASNKQEAKQAKQKLVDVDGGGGVDLEEFETWWLASNKQEAKQAKQKLVMRADALIQNLDKFRELLIRSDLPTEAQNLSNLFVMRADALIQNLDKFRELLIRNDLPTEAQNFSNLFVLLWVMRADALIQNLDKFRELLIRSELPAEAKKFQAHVHAMKHGHAHVHAMKHSHVFENKKQAHGRVFENNKQVITPTPLRGNWQETVEQYETLMWNGEQLDVDPLLVINPASISDKRELCMCLGEQLELMCGLLKSHGGKRQHADIFKGFIDELSSPSAVDAMVRNMGTSHRGMGGDGGFSKFAIVRGMIAMNMGPEAQAYLVEMEAKAEEEKEEKEKEAIEQGRDPPEKETPVEEPPKLVDDIQRILINRSGTSGLTDVVPPCIDTDTRQGGLFKKVCGNLMRVKAVVDELQTGNPCGSKDLQRTLSRVASRASSPMLPRTSELQTENKCSPKELLRTMSREASRASSPMLPRTVELQTENSCGPKELLGTMSREASRASSPMLPRTAELQTENSCGSKELLKTMSRGVSRASSPMLARTASRASNRSSSPAMGLSTQTGSRSGSPAMGGASHPIPRPWNSSLPVLAAQSSFLLGGQSSSLLMPEASYGSLTGEDSSGSIGSNKSPVSFPASMPSLLTLSDSPGGEKNTVRAMPRSRSIRRPGESKSASEDSPVFTLERQRNTLSPIPRSCSASLKGSSPGRRGLSLRCSSRSAGSPSGEVLSPTPVMSPLGRRAAFDIKFKTGLIDV
eukprot:gene21011-27871_t